MQKDFGSLEEILFEHRNKNYGAYELRNSQNTLMTKALFIGVGISILITFIFYLYSSMNSRESKYVEDINYTVFSPTEIPPKTLVKKDNTIRNNAKNSSITSPKQNIIKSTSATQKVEARVGTPSKDPVNEHVMASKQEMNNSEISVLTSKGIENPNSSVSGSIGKTNLATGNSSSGADSPGNSVIEAGGVDEEAVYPGGMNALRTFISRQMEYPELAAKNNVQGKVIVRFIVEKDGTVSGFKVLKGIGSGCEEEILRILKKTNKKWKPAKLNGENVRTYFTLPVHFTLQNL